MLSEHSSSSLTLTTSRFGNHVRLHCGDLFVFFTVELFDVYRLEDSHMNATAAVLAPAALPPVLADAAAATVLAVAELLFRSCRPCTMCVVTKASSALRACLCMQNLHHCANSERSR